MKRKIKEWFKIGWYGFLEGFRKLIVGDAVSSLFFKKHFFVIAILMLSCILFIGQRFDHKGLEIAIERTQIEISRAKSAKIQEQAIYKTLTRESKMRHMIDSLHLKVDIPDRRPEVIITDAEINN